MVRAMCCRTNGCNKQDLEPRRCLAGNGTEKVCQIEKKEQPLKCSDHMQANRVRLRRLQEREEEGVDLRLRQQVRHKGELEEERRTRASASSEMLREELL